MRWLVLLFLSACNVEVVVLRASDRPSDAGAADAAQSDAEVVIPNSTWTLAAGFDHTCATRGGRLYCWGNGSRGALGGGDYGSSTAPVAVGTEADWQAVA